MVYFRCPDRHVYLLCLGKLEQSGHREQPKGERGGSGRSAGAMKHNTCKWNPRNTQQCPESLNGVIEGGGQKRESRYSREVSGKSTGLYGSCNKAQHSQFAGEVSGVGQA